VVTKIYGVKIRLEVETNHADHHYDYDLGDYGFSIDELDDMLKNIKEQIEYWLHEEGK